MFKSNVPLNCFTIIGFIYEVWNVDSLKSSEAYIIDIDMEVIPIVSIIMSYRNLTITKSKYDLDVG